ncbi:zinc finger protein 454 isoform X1 [Oncorhynchus masou masou]|uniref:zinc finger protein 454 isoform X1 n=2 Tax=Oncorhynchus masou masou TaxID=90313 RepID=UPI003183984F
MYCRSSSTQMMSPVNYDFQDIRPVTLHLPEETVTSLYCVTAKGLEAQVASLVEAFLVEVYRCRVCQFTSGLKGSIQTHVLERHDLGASSCPGLPCLEKDNGLEVGVGVDREDDDDDELDQNGSPGYNLEDDLHSVSKDADDDQMDHMGLERMSFLLPMYGMLPNISPRSCDMALSSNSDGSLHVAQTCEVSTLFEEDERHVEEDEEESVFRLDAADSVNLSCPMGSVVKNEAKDDEMAQSAHLMTLGLCRISTANKGLSGRAVTQLPSTPIGQEGLESDTSLDDKMPQSQGKQSPPPHGSKQRRSLFCVLCRATLTSRHLLEVHLKCHNGDRGFKCLQCGWTSAGWGEMERHWRAHGKRMRRGKKEKERGIRPHGCQVCLRKFRSVKSRDAHERRHHSQRRSPQECFTCQHCDYSDKSWDKLHKHILSEHKAFGDRLTNPDGLSTHVVCALRKFTHESNYPQDLQGVEPEKWNKWIPKQRGRKDGEEGREERREEQGQKAEESVRKKGRKEFCCALCNRKFSTKLTMRRHMGIHQGDKPFECPHCHYSTRLKASLVQHLRVHTGEKPFKCLQCPYASIDSSSLRRHSRTHTQERPYCCQYCPYSSIQKKSLDLHARRHHTGESFPCHLCPYATPDRQLLLRHVRKHHSSEPSHVLGPRTPKRPKSSVSAGRVQ